MATIWLLLVIYAYPLEYRHFEHPSKNEGMVQTISKWDTRDTCDEALMKHRAARPRPTPIDTAHPFALVCFPVDVEIKIR